MEGGKIKKAPKPFGLRALTLSMFQLSAVRTGLEPDIAHNLIFRLLQRPLNFL